METDNTKLYKEKSCSDVEKVFTYCPKKWLEDRPKPFVEFALFVKSCHCLVQFSWISYAENFSSSLLMVSFVIGLY